MYFGSKSKVQYKVLKSKYKVQVQVQVLLGLGLVLEMTSTFPKYFLFINAVKTTKCRLPFIHNSLFKNNPKAWFEVTDRPGSTKSAKNGPKEHFGTGEACRLDRYVLPTLERMYLKST